MSPQLKEFIYHVGKAETDKFSERVVRNVIAGCATSCPVELAVLIGRLVIDFRKAEMVEEAEAN